MSQQNPYESTEQPTTLDRRELENRRWAMLLHLSLLVGCVIFVVGWILPIAIWQVKRDEMPEIDKHGKIVANWMVSTLLYGAICLPLLFWGIGFSLIVLLWIANLLFAVIGALKASSGQAWRYPFSLRLL